MIRAYRPDDRDRVLQVWIAASMQAHRFLDDEFLARERAAIRDVHLPATDTWVWESGGQLSGFISLLGNEVGALFVDPAEQRSGIGRALMDHARTLHPVLELEVFRENDVGRAFYARYGFTSTGTHVHEPTGHELIRMRLDSTAIGTDPPPE